MTCRPGGAWALALRRTGRKNREMAHDEPEGTRERPDMIKGTLDMLILKVLSLEALHGWGISERIQDMSRDQLQVSQGSLYASLHRLTRQAWIRSEWHQSENNRRARYYRLTPAGERRLGKEQEHWSRLAEAVNRIMKTS